MSSSIASSENDAYSRRQVFKMIKKMEHDELRQLLNATKGQLALTEIMDETGYTPLQFSCSKNMLKSSEVLIDFVLQ